MSPTQVEAAQGQKDQTVRGKVEYHASAWGDFFLNLQLPAEEVVNAWKEEVELLKEKAREKLIATHDKHIQQLEFIDTIQRLGIAGYVQSEIDEILNETYNSYDDYNNNDDELHTVALRFRLLRQECYNVSSDVFNKFQDENGTFKEMLRSDVQGILSLYEASCFGMQGETILDEALAFTKAHLSSVVDNLDPHLVEHVKHALHRPIRRTLTKMGVCYFIPRYEKNESHDKNLLRLAKLHFNINQNIYQKELRSHTSWWKDLDFTTKFPYARDRLVECYYWNVEYLPEPEYSFARLISARFFQLGTTMDDTFDIRATPDELELLTQTFESWDYVEGLPNYLKEFFHGIALSHEDIKRQTTSEGRPYAAYYTRESQKELVRSYMQEIRWFKKGYVPTVEEYLAVGDVSTNYPFFFFTALCGMGELATKENFEWLSKYPKLIIACADICRVMDDIVSHQRERQMDHGPSSIECYMNQYGVSREEAIDVMKKVLDKDWKIINEEMLKEVDIPKRVRALALDLARFMDTFYTHCDGFTNATGFTKDMAKAVLVTPMNI